MPPAPFRDPKVTGNPAITVTVTEHGGHCGFVAAPSAESDGYWAEEQVVSFCVPEMLG